ncbi:hypothetical protein B0H21DRAFT_577954 [Amylocystis lapponica]|nr:hypothetical protein B0H21DRAFT_577954 [Amylocystis lapponica]
MYSPTRARMSTNSPPRIARKPASTNGMPPGFRAAPRPKPQPITELSVPELQEIHARNERLLAEPIASTSTYVQRISAEQAAVEARLIDLVGVEAIRTKLAHTSIDNDAMNVDVSPISPSPSGALPPNPQPRPIDTKARILANFNPQPRNGRAAAVATISFEEAARIEQEAHAQDLKRQQEVLDRKRRQGIPIRGEVLTRQEQEARIWRFMNYKPSGSDMEDDDDDDDDDDPATWFEDDQDDGRKGQDIVEPDDDISHIIRIDESRIPYPLPREE